VHVDANDIEERRQLECCTWNVVDTRNDVGIV
jgi:hypothetical protein